MKILLFIDGLACGGKERQLFEIACGLLTERHVAAQELLVVTMRANEHYESLLVKAGVNVRHLVRTWRWDPLVILSLRGIFQSFRPDVIHCFSPMTSFYTSLTVLPQKSRFIDGSIRDSFASMPLIERAIYRLTFQRANLILSNSAAGLQAKKAPLEKSVVLYNGFDHGRLIGLPSPALMRKLLGLSASPTIGMVASFSPYKDWSTFCEAARVVHARFPSASFLAIGGGAGLADIMARYRTLPNLHFLGHRSDVEAVESICDVGVLCSEREGIPNAMMEFMALGKPVITTALGGTTELIEDGLTGYIIKPQMPTFLAEKILYLLANPEIARSMGAAGQQRIQVQCSIGHIVSELVAMYNRVLASPPGEG